MMLGTVKVFEHILMKAGKKGLCGKIISYTQRKALGNI